MAIDTKKYLDYAGLQQFWTQVKGYYTKADGTGAVVDKAKVLNENIVFKKVNDQGVFIEDLGTTRFDATEKKYEVYFEEAKLGKVNDVQTKTTSDGSYTSVLDGRIAKIDLSGYAKKSDLASFLKFKGSCTGDELAAKTDMAQGDVWFVTATGTTEATKKYKKDYEYAYNGTDWVELGGPIDLSAYKVWDKEGETEEAMGTKQYIIKAVGIEETRATGAESALSGRLDVIEGDDTVDGSVKKALKDAKAYTDSSIGGLDSTVSQTAGADGLALQVVEVDGKLTSVSGSIAANTYDAYGAAETVKGEVEEEISDEAEARKAGDVEVYNAFLSIEDYKIKQLFFKDEEKKAAGTSAELVAAVNAMEANNVLVTLTSDIAVTERLVVADGKNVIINLNGHTLTTPAADRAVNVAPGGYCAIANGVIAGNNGTYNVVVRGNGNLGAKGSTLIMENITMTNAGEGNLLLATNGSDKDVNLLFNNCDFTGALYLPAKGSIIFNGGKLESHNMAVLVVKNGCPIEFNNVSLKMVVESGYDAKWAHCENGAMDSPATLVIEACNYGGQSNPEVTLKDCKVEVVDNRTAEEKAQKGEVFDVLVINYNGNVPAKFDTNVPYFKSANITGHVTIDGTDTPTDGWLYFTTAEGKEGSVTRH